MTKAAEFEALVERADYLHARPDRGNPGDFVRAESAFNSFCWHNSDLIARALRRDEVVEQGASPAQQGTWGYKVHGNLDANECRRAVVDVLDAFREAVQ